MNKEYTYIDGKVIISDENDTKVQSEYYDNLDKVLVQENLIETMEKKIQEFEKESVLYHKYSENRYIPVIFPMAALVSTIGAPLITNWLISSNSFTIPVDNMFGPMIQIMEASIPMLICSAAIELFMHSVYKSFRKEGKGINSELSFLRQQIKKAREDLEKLKQDKSRDNESTEFRTVKVDDREQLKILKEYLNLYFDLGYNGENYYQYYQQGKLDIKLQKYYSDAALQVAKEYMEENGSLLILRKKEED